MGEVRRISVAAMLLLGTCLLFCVAGTCVGQSSGKSRSIKPQRIKIYFYHDPGEYIDLSPVTRVIRSASPARAAINALLAGPTRAEEKRGFSSLSSADEFAIGKLSIKDGRQ